MDVYARPYRAINIILVKTTQHEIRLESHFISNGSSWTKKYIPIKVIELIPDCDDYDEDKYTLKYMQKYGINNVRGGSFVNYQKNDKMDQLTYVIFVVKMDNYRL